MKILLLDDDDEILDLFNAILNPHVISIFKAKTQQAAFNYLKLKSVDLFIVDIMLENESGTDFIRKLRNIGNKTKCIVCSSLMDSEIEDQTNSLENIQLLKKPFSKKDILNIVGIKI